MDVRHRTIHDLIEWIEEQPQDIRQRIATELLPDTDSFMSVKWLVERAMNDRKAPARSLRYWRVGARKMPIEVADEIIELIFEGVVDILFKMADTAGSPPPAKWERATPYQMAKAGREVFKGQSGDYLYSLDPELPDGKIKRVNKRDVVVEGSDGNFYRINKQDFYDHYTI